MKNRATYDEIDFSIILVNRDASAYLAGCLKSIAASAGDLTLEVILIDNASRDDSIAVARQLWPKLVLLEQHSNIGYVPANNLGLTRARGRYSVFLNNDTELEPSCLSELKVFLDRTPDAGAVSGQILNPDGTDQGCARRFPTVANALFGRRSALTRWFPENRWSKRYLMSRHHRGSEPFEVEILSSACLVVRTELARALCGMDEDFRLYWVDAELCSRVRRRGYRVVCVPQARLVHFEGKGGSTRTFRQRLDTTLCFQRDAYLAYTKVWQLPVYHPGSLFAALALSLRALVLLVVQLLRPERATSSGVG